MAKLILEHSASSLNLSRESYDSLINCLSKAHALTHMALSEHFAWSDNAFIHDYLSLLEDLIIEAKEDFEAIWKMIESKNIIEAEPN